MKQAWLLLGGGVLVVIMFTMGIEARALIAHPGSNYLLTSIVVDGVILGVQAGAFVKYWAELQRRTG